MAENQIQIGLAGQPERSQIRSFWKDVTEFYMLVLQRAFLPGLHGVAVKYPCPSCAIRGGLHSFGGRKLCPTVGQ